MARGTILFLAGLVALLVAFAGKEVLIAPPDAPTSAPPGTFDAARAFDRLARVIGDGTPHPVDSAGSDGVRARLIAEMRAVGLEPRISDAMVCNGFARARSVACARVRNLAATIGPAAGPHLLLVAHYDGVPVGPGAADDGIGIATLLEIAAQLRGRALRQPVTFLFNEGEESGLLGARAFLDGDPAAGQVTTLANIEARGVDGPAIMFETSRPNGAAVSLYAAAVERPVANSLSTDFYRLLPNSTDVAVFEERPWTILNLAIIGNETRYHSAGDDLAALDRRSLFHMGSQALALAGAHAAGGAPGASGELLYADLLTRHLVTLPLSVGLVLLGLIVLAFAVLLVRRGAWGGALLACLAGVAGAAFSAWILTVAVQALRPGEFWRAYPLAMQVAAAATAVLAVVAALGLARVAGRDQQRVAAWFLITVTGGAICFVAPGAAIYFLFAPLVILAGIALERWLPGAERAAAWLAALVQLLTLLPIIALVELLLSTSPGWIAAPLAVLAALPLVIELRPDAGSRAATGGLAAAALAAWGTVLAVPAYSADRQENFTVEHLQDRIDGKAEWGIYSDGGPLPDAFAQWGPWRRDGVVYARRQRWVAAAPEDDRPAPVAERLGERRVAGGRLVTLRLAMRGWDGAVLQVPAAAHLRALTAGDTKREFGGTGGDYQLRCTGRSCDGFTFDLLVGTDRPVDAMLIGNVARLPAIARPLVDARPSLARPQYVPDASYALTPVRL